MEVTIVICAILAFVAFRQWLRHQRRVMVHRERIAAIEKGVQPPPFPEEPERNRGNVQRFLLLSGLIWLAIGLGFVAVGAVVFSDPALQRLPEPPPPSLFLGGLIPAFVGLAHLVVYFVDRRSAR